MFKNALLLCVLPLLLSPCAHADKSPQRSVWLQDKNFIEGMLHLKGESGYSFIEKEMDNCPYEKCKNSDSDKSDMRNITTLKIKKPNYKKAIEFLSTSSDGLNPIASDNLILFLNGRLAYKSKEQSSYLLKLLNEDTGLSYATFSSLFANTAKNGYLSKGCASAYFYGEILANGYLNIKKDSQLAKKAYKKANENCPKQSLYKMLSSGKI